MNKKEKKQKQEESKKKWEERGEKMEKTGKKIKSWGCTLTILLTIPLILTIFLGVPGLIISVGIVVLYIVGKKNKD